MANKELRKIEEWSGPVWIAYPDGDADVVLMDDLNMIQEVKKRLEAYPGAKVFAATEQSIYSDEDFHILESAVVSDLEQLGFEQVVEQLNLKNNESWKKVRAAWNVFLEENKSINKSYQIIPGIKLEV